MLPTISVIVPVYNAEKYLNECITSIQNQSYPSIELILVNDGSTDSSGEICDQYASADSNISVIHLPGNGVSSARNHGISAATGKYIAFVDSDDFVDTDFISHLYEAMISEHIQTDLSICGLQRFTAQGEQRDLLEGSDLSMNQAELIESVLCNNNIGGYMCNKLYRMDIIREHGLRLNETLSIGEDMVFIAQYLTHCSHGTYLNQPLYRYRINQASALQAMYHTGQFDPAKLSNLKSAQAIHTTLSQYCNDRAASISEKDRDKILKACSYRMSRTGMWTIFNTLKCNYYDPELLGMIRNDYIRPNLRAYLGSSYASFSEKASARFFACTPRLFWKAAQMALSITPQRLIKRHLG